MQQTHRPVNISRIIYSNAVPNAVERATIQLEIDTLSKSISKLQQKIQELGSRVRKRRAALSPVRLLPPEVLSEIFSHVIGEEAKYWTTRKFFLQQLRLVCKSWSQAVPPPVIWGQQIIDPYQDRSFYGAVADQLRRAGSTRKSLHIWPDNCDCDSPGVTCALASPDVVKLLKTGPMLDRLDIICYSPECVINLLNSVDAGSPRTVDPPTASPWSSLKHLSLRFNGSPPDRIGDYRAIGNRLPPQISTLDIAFTHGFVIYEDDEQECRNVSFNFPPPLLNRLESFRFSCDWPGTHILEVMEHLVNAEKLALTAGLSNFAHFGAPDNPLLRRLSRSRLLLPKVKSLHLGFAWSIDILDLLNIPELLHLRIGIHRGLTLDTPFRLHKPIIDLLKASGRSTSLHTLHLYDVQTPNAELLDTIRDLPHLKKLIIDEGTGVSGDHLGFWKGMVERGEEALEAGAKWYLSQLENLELLNASPDFGYHMVAYFFEKRLAAAPDTTPHCLWTLSYAATKGYPATEVDLKRSVKERFEPTGVCARLIVAKEK